MGLKVAKKAKATLLAELESLGFDKMRAATRKPKAKNAIISEEEAEDSQASYDYLLGMPLWNLTKEKVEQLKKEQEERTQELNILLETTKEQMWGTDLDDFEGALSEFEEQVAKDAKQTTTKKKNSAPLKKSRKKPAADTKTAVKKVVKKTTVKKTTKAAVDSDDEMDDFLDEEEEDVKPTPRPRAAATKAKAPVKAKKSIEDFFEEPAAVVGQKRGRAAATKKASPPPKKPTRSRLVLDISDDESDEDMESLRQIAKPTKTAATKPAPKAATKAAPKAAPKAVPTKPAVQKKAPTKPVPKKVPAKEESESEEVLGELSDMESESSEMIPVAKPAGRRAAASKARTVIMESDSEDASEAFSGMDGGSE